MIAEVTKFASGMSLEWALVSAVIGLVMISYIVVKLVVEARSEKD